MLRLTLMLSATIYALLVIYSDGAVSPDAEPVEVARAAPDAAPALLSAEDERMQLTTAAGDTLHIAAVINPADLMHLDDDVAMVSTFLPGGDNGSALSAGRDLPLVQVTGSTVNLRAGPSTGDAVLGSLVRGEQAELIASLGNGWAQIRAVASGTEGFMADRFLSPVN